MNQFLKKNMSMNFEEKYEHEKNFSAYYSQFIKPILYDLEKRRFNAKVFYFLALVLSYGMIGLLVYYDMHERKNFSLDSEALLSLLGLIMIAYVPSALIKRFFEKTNKSKIMEAIMGFFPDIKYDFSKSIPASDIRHFLITPYYTHYNGSDLIERSGHFVASRIITKYRRKKTTNVTFNGLGILINLPKTIPHNIALKTDCGNTVNWLNNIGTGYKRVNLVDPVFEKIFEVYGDDQTKTRAVLSPDIMELFLRINFLFSNWNTDFNELEIKTRATLKNHNIEEVRKNLKSNLKANFMDNKLLLLIDSPQNMFEPVSLFKSSFDTSSIRFVLYQIHLINQIHDVLITNKVNK